MILPATPLLVPGLVPARRPDPLAAVRDAVAGALTELVAEPTGGALPLVVAHGPAPRHGPLRPSLAGSGISDRWLPPGLPAAWGRGGHGPAGTGASVALLALAPVLGERAGDVPTLEVAGPPDAAAVAALRAAPVLVVAGGGAPGSQDRDPAALTPGVRAALREAGVDLAGARVLTFPQEDEHLPSAYRVVTA